jgi:hypothetical protein
MAEQPIVVFDVNETLLDLEAIRPTFDRIFDDPAAMRSWFAGPITYSEALTLAGVYVPFTDIGGALLRTLGATRGVAITDADGAELTQRFASMPAHPEVPGALRRLREHKPAPEAYDSVGSALDVGPQPNYTGDDLDAVADQLIEKYSASSMTLAGVRRP